MVDGFDPILWVGNSTKLGWAIDEMFLGSKESLFEVYFGLDLIPINEYGFGPHEVQSWLGLIKISFDILPQNKCITNLS
jgi:hypothetical protein